jgi:hypothetical protein
MISERHLAAGFQGFWSDLLPLLTPAFVRVFNEAYAAPLIDDRGERVKAIPIGGPGQRHDLVAELAFNAAKLSWEHDSSVAFVLQDDEMRNNLVGSSLALLRQYQNVALEISEISQHEWQEARMLAEVYGPFVRQWGPEATVEFSPKIPGSGFLGSCYADLSINQTLFEVKTVNRNIAGKDIRQLIVYLALQAASGNRRWVSAGFLNPRRAKWYQFSIDHLIYRTSGGRVASEVFQEMIDFLSSRETEFDIAF